MALGAGASSCQECSVVSGQSSNCGYWVNLVETTAWVLVGYGALAASFSVDFHFFGFERLIFDISMYFAWFWPRISGLRILHYLHCLTEV